MATTVAFDQDWSRPNSRLRARRCFAGLAPAFPLIALGLVLTAVAAIFLALPRPAARLVAMVSIDLPPPVIEPQETAPAPIPPVLQAVPAAAPERVLKPAKVAEAPPITKAVPETARVMNPDEVVEKPTASTASAPPRQVDSARWEPRVAFARKESVGGKAESLIEAGNRILAAARTGEAYKKALPWFLMAAQEGSAPGAFNAGQAFRMGRLGRYPDRQAAGWYRRAADKGYAPAKLNLGLMYMLGEGLEKNTAQGLKWIAEAAANGNAKALKMMIRYGS